MTEFVRVERGGPNDAVARVTLDRPDLHNAFNATLIAELRHVFTSFERETPTDLRVVILAGNGPSFCAGADIDWMRAAMQLDVEANEHDAMAMIAPLERKPRRHADLHGDFRRHRKNIGPSPDAVGAEIASSHAACHPLGIKASLGQVLPQIGQRHASHLVSVCYGG